MNYPRNRCHFEVWENTSTMTSMLGIYSDICAAAVRIVLWNLIISVAWCPERRQESMFSHLYETWRHRYVTQQAPDVGSKLDQRCPLTLDQCYENVWIWKLDQRNIFNIGSTLGFQCWIDIRISTLDQCYDIVWIWNLDQPNICNFRISTLDQRYEIVWIWKLDQHNICNIG